MATWPVSPKHWATPGGRRWCENRCRGKNLGGRDRPEHCADPSWLFRVHAFQARGAEVTRAAIPDASCIQHTIGAIALGSSFLGIERMMGGTEQIAIRLERKSRSWKPTRKRPLCPVRGAIHQNWCRFTGCYKLADWGRWSRLRFTSRSKFGGLHGSGRKALSEFQAQIPDPWISRPLTCPVRFTPCRLRWHIYSQRRRSVFFRLCGYRICSIGRSSRLMATRGRP